jgi:hypothetical protein
VVKFSKFVEKGRDENKIETFLFLLCLQDRWFEEVKNWLRNK